MSDQLFDGLKSIAGDALSQTGRMRALTAAAAGGADTLGQADAVGKADAIGNSESSSGNSLPPSDDGGSPDLEALAEDLRTVSMSIGRDLRFIVDLESSQPIIQVLDSETGEIIRQIPADVVASYSLSDGAQAVHLLDLLA